MILWGFLISSICMLMLQGVSIFSVLSESGSTTGVEWVIQLMYLTKFASTHIAILMMYVLSYRTRLISGKYFHKCIAFFAIISILLFLMTLLSTSRPSMPLGENIFDMYLGMSILTIVLFFVFAMQKLINIHLRRN